MKVPLARVGSREASLRCLLGLHLRVFVLKELSHLLELGSDRYLRLRQAIRRDWGSDSLGYFLGLRPLRKVRLGDRPSSCLS